VYFCFNKASLTAWIGTLIFFGHHPDFTLHVLVIHI